MVLLYRFDVEARMESPIIRIRLPGATNAVVVGAGSSVVSGTVLATTSVVHTAGSGAGSAPIPTVATVGGAVVSVPSAMAPQPVRPAVTPAPRQSAAEALRARVARTWPWRGDMN